MTYEYWSPSDTDLLESFAKKMTLSELALYFHRSEMAVMHKLGRMGISLAGAKRTVRKPTSNPSTSGRCTDECVGGNRCCLTNEFAHELHICSEDDGRCLCHSDAAYLAAKRMRLMEERGR